MPIGYKGLTIATAPTEPGGIALNDNFTELADRVGPVAEFAFAPDVTDDGANTSGNGTFHKWSKWRNTTTDDAYVCLDNSTGAAIWKLTTATAGSPDAHASTHEQGGGDAIDIEDLGTSEGDTNKILAPDGAGGMEFVDAPLLLDTVTTTNGTETTIATISPAANSVVHISAFIVAKRTDGGSDDRATFIRRAVAYRDSGGGATLQGIVSTDMTRRSDEDWDATIDVSGNDVRIRVQGDAGQTIDWQVKYLVNELII